MNPYPLETPALSAIILESFTAPYAEKNCLSSCSVVLAAIPPTNILFGITVPNFGAPLNGVPHGVVDGLTSPEDV